MIERQDLFLKYRETGDIAIRNEIVLLYMDTVKYTALHLRNVYAKGYDADDLINEGVLALISATETFDVTRQIKFETYASLKVKGAIIDYIRKQDWVPRRVRRFGRELDNAYGMLYNELNRCPTNQELADYMELTMEQFEKKLSDTAGANVLSFEELLYQDNFAAIDSDESFADRQLYSKEQKQVIAEAIASLKPKEQQVVSLYYYEKLKLREIAEVLNVSESRVSQIHSKCMLILKQKLEKYIKE
jgi:RNA polymerase sigma factor for flagellar operon FliA